MKSRCLLLPVLMLCACGKKQETQAERNAQLNDLGKKTIAALEEVLKVEDRMRNLPPGGELEIESANLRAAQKEYEAAKAAYNEAKKE
ncbi:MAG TPA: hypothetical protein VG796_06790 [Verrucomicrobiales bacterium]|jgi:hypothetical protein|nr:hypothetical protein [Verrucomicrobiales bacterium]